MNPWALVDKAEKSAETAKVYAKASGAQRTTWWWD
jgi:hypothetical protein